MRPLRAVLHQVIKALPVEMREQLERAQADQGPGCVSSTTGGLWVEDIPGEVEELLSGMLRGRQVEIVIRPEDEDGHHWSVGWYLLEPDENGRLMRVDMDG